MRPALNPAVVCAHLTMLAAQVANSGLIVDAEGRPRPRGSVPRVSPGRLAAINRASELIHDVPGGRQVMWGPAREMIERRSWEQIGDNLRQLSGELR